MKIRLALLLCALMLLLAGCGYWVVEDEPVQVGALAIQTTLPPLEALN